MLNAAGVLLLTLYMLLAQGGGADLSPSAINQTLTTIETIVLFFKLVHQKHILVSTLTCRKTGVAQDIFT